MRRALVVVFGGLALLLAGYRLAQSSGGSNTTTTVTAPNPSGYAPPAPTSTVARTTPARPAASDPVVAFTWTVKNPHAIWPFTAQLANITLDPNGFPGSGGEPPQDSYLMVQVNITSGITGRLVPPPDLQGMIVCRGPGDHGWSSMAEGYDAGPETAPDLSGADVPLGDGQPHPWDIEWVVPNGTPAARVRCKLGPDPNASFAGEPTLVSVVGKRRLN